MSQARAEVTRAPLVFNVTVAAPPETVFRTFVYEPTRWLCRSATVTADTGGTFQVCWPDACVEGRYVQVVAPNTVRFSWHFVGDGMPETMVVASFAPAERDGQPVTALGVEHYGFGSGPDWDPLYLGATRAWAGYLKNLRAVLEHGVDLREADE